MNEMDKELIQNNIYFLKEYIPKLIVGIETEVELLMKNNEKSAFELFYKILEGLEWTIRSINSLEEVGYLTDLKMNKMNETLFETESAFQKKDFVLLGDLLKYEIEELLINWEKKVNFLGDIR
ncbi:hypothetical protein [Rossellomorea sp. LjRoot5]|uniref:hypothetical protein n=1 Tax=Rossellomorea sp. LjRoot5 TaxID=3342331 RepID=UPI003ECFEE84